MKVKVTSYLIRFASGWIQWRPLFLLSILAFYWLAFREISVRDNLMALGNWTIEEPFLLALVNVLIIAAMCIRLGIILKRCGVTVSIRQLALYRIAANAISYITPGPHVGGEPLQIHRLVRDHHLPAELAIAAVMTDRAIEMIANLALICIGSLYLMRFSSIGATISIQLMVIPLLILTGICVLLKMVASGRRPLYTFTKWIQKFVGLRSLRSTWTTALTSGELKTGEILSQPQSTLCLYFGCALIQWLLMCAEFWIIYAMIGVSLKPLELIATVLVARLAFLLPLPGALGALEASQVMILAYLQMPPGAGLAACMIMRTRDFILVGAGVGLASFWLGARFQSKNTAS